MGDQIQAALDGFAAPTSDTNADKIQSQIDSFSTNATGNNPVVKTALSDVGDQSYNGYCQSFVEQIAYGKQKMFPTAIDAWNSYSQSGQGKQGTDGIQPGDLVYFTPTAQVPAGHTGIYQGDNKFVSATDTGVQSNDLTAWQKGTGQQVLGYVRP